MEIWAWRDHHKEQQSLTYARATSQIWLD